MKSLVVATIYLVPNVCAPLWHTLLEPSSKPATIAECERAGVKNVVATYNAKIRGTNIYHRRVCLSKMGGLRV